MQHDPTIQLVCIHEVCIDDPALGSNIARFQLTNPKGMMHDDIIVIAMRSWYDTPLQLWYKWYTTFKSKKQSSTNLVHIQPVQQVL